MSTPTYNKREVHRILKDNGFTLHHKKGSHAIYKNKNGRHITISLCRCNKMIFQRLVKENDLIVW